MTGQSVYERMRALVELRYPNYADLWHGTRKEFGAAWEAEFSEAIALIFGAIEAGWDEPIDGYAEFCTDALRSQIFFERHGHYKASSYGEVTKAYYHNADFMCRCYLPGMFISHFIWPHHHRMLRYFRSLMTDLRGTIRSFYEIGTGCGLYSKELLQLVPESRGEGFDISEYALSFTNRVLVAFGLADRYKVHQQDILTHPPDEPADLVISQEVLEHLEDPEVFLRGLAAMTRRGGYAYIAAAVNAGHVDHIYLYRSPREIADQITAAGFAIIDQRSEYAYTNKPMELRPCHTGFLCRRGSA